ncbi:MAG TPA: hypothetical protein VJ836_06465 [Candidatus Saccharimonadales bacterium]|nr:hypothetical protein [Candidatus Saccharimonadales bacterium]
MQNRLIKGAITVLAVVSVAVAVPQTVAAHAGHDHEAEDKTKMSRPANSQTEGTLKDRLQQLTEQRKEIAGKRLDAAKLKVCEQRKKNITTIMARNVTRTENHLKLFETIANRTKAFYEEKGRTLANYSQLVAAVDTAKAEVTTDLAVFKAQQFTCDSEDPKGSIEAYKTAHQTILQDLKDYRTAIKNLIVGVKSVQSQESDNE